MSNEITKKVDNNFFEKLNRYSNTISADPFIVSLLTKEGIDKVRTTHLLNLTKDIIGGSIVYVMNRDGDVIGSSNYNGGKTLLGENYGFRPYFKEGLKGRSNLFPALGITTKKRGIYAASPVLSSNKVVGVVVIKYNANIIDQLFEKADFPASLIVSNEIIFSSNNKDLIFKSINDLSRSLLDSLKRNKQFDDREISSLAIDINEKVVTYEGINYSPSTKTINNENWKLLYLYPKFVIDYVKLFSIIISTIFIYIIFFYTIDLYRRKDEESNEKNRVKQLLKDNQELLGYITDNSSAIIYIKDLKGRYIFTNKVFRTLFNLTKSQLKNRTDYEIFQKSSADIFTKNDKAVLKRDVTIEFEEILPLNNNTHTYISTKFPIKDSNGEIYGICGISTDITDRKLLENQLTIANDRAEEVNRSKTKFLANLSHELKTPVNSIIGLSRYDKIDQNHQSSKRINAIALQLNRVISNILDFSKMEDNQYHTRSNLINIRSIIEEVLDSLDTLIEKKEVEVELYFDSQLTNQIESDGELIKKIVFNLVESTLNQSESGDKLSLAATYVDSRLFFKLSNGNLNLPMKKVKQVFDQHGVFDKLFDTTLLGLAVVKRAVDILNGKISIESSENSGIIYTVEIDIIKKSLCDRVNNKSSDDNHFRKDNQVLIIEENPINQKVLTIILRNFGLKNIYSAQNYSEGVDVIKEITSRGFKPNLIFINLEPPHYKGLGIAEKIGEAIGLNSTPIAAFTKDMRLEDDPNVVAAGVTDLLSKPINVEKLKSILHKHLR